MCTVSWLETPSGHELFFTRDESRLRGRGRPPEQATVDGVDFLAPTDSDSGGTWIAVNSKGLSVCLLNHYPRGYRQPPSETLISRGLLVQEMATHGAVNPLFDALSTKDLARYAPFTLLAIADL